MFLCGHTSEALNRIDKNEEGNNASYGKYYSHDDGQRKFDCVSIILEILIARFHLVNNIFKLGNVDNESIILGHCGVSLSKNFVEYNFPLPQ